MPYTHEEWQIEHLEGALKALTYPIREIMMIRTRGGSKTQDTMKLCLYLIYLGFEGLYFTANASQLERPKIYMKHLISKSFLKYCVLDQRKMQVELEGGGMLTLENLTESKAISPRADFIVFDEERKADSDAYNNTLGIFSNTEMLFTIHISTPEKASIFEDNYDALKAREEEYGVPLVFERVLEDVSFLWDHPARRARYQEIMRKAPQWFVDQEFHCKFILPHGAVFHNVVYEPYEAWLENAIKDQPNCSGVDWNPAAGHVRSTVKWTLDLQSVVVVGEAVFSTGYAREMKRKEFSLLMKWFTKGNSIVLEDGGINIPYIDWFSDMLEETNFNWPEQRWHSEEWDNQDIAKMKACTYVMQHGITIYVDKIRFPLTAKQIEECSWDEKALGSNPKLKKDSANSPHFLDAFLHAISDKNRDDYRYEVADW